MNTREIQVIRAGRGHVAELKSLFRDIVAESQPTSMEDQRAAETGFDRSTHAWGRCSDGPRA